jgi:hypothetical protein
MTNSPAGNSNKGTVHVKKIIVPFSEDEREMCANINKGLKKLEVVIYNELLAVAEFLFKRFWF